MENLTYKPGIYEGGDPYIFISYHPDDQLKVKEVVEKLELRGFRYWLNDGIAPGMETDEIIAEHIEKCDFFIAFLSNSYLSTLDTIDELNFSRDVDKEYLLVYLEEATLPAGIDMRFMRAQSISAYSLSQEEVFAQLININKANRFYGIADPEIQGTAEAVFAKLEKLYPEHKVFALDAVGKQLSKKISELYVKAGYPSAERLMNDYGFKIISSEEARAIRNSVIYQPGYEPDTIKPRIDYIFEVLQQDYPDKMINDDFAKSHKSIYKSLLGISVWMGYGSPAEMLQAYGYQGLTTDAGRTAIDHENVLKQLSERYRDKIKPAGLTKLISENPDMKGVLKTLSNRSNELFGVTFAQHLKQIGLIVPVEKEEKSTVTARNNEIIIEEIRALYTEKPEVGRFEDVEESLKQLVLKKNVKGEVYVKSCGACSETMEIPFGVDFIAKEAFVGQSDLITLILPETLKEINEGAFYDCDGLTEIVFSEGLEKIGNQAFANCTSLEEIKLPKTLKMIGNEAFLDCESLATVEFANLRTNIQEDAFDGCEYELENLQDEDASPAEYFELKVDKKNNAKIIEYTGDEEIVVIPGAISGHPILSIEKGSFKGNEYIREVYISDQIGGVNGDVFKDCKNLEKVHISEKVSSLTGTVFSGCSNLTEVNIPDNMAEVQRGLFKDSPLTTLYIGKGAKKISSDAFYKGVADFATGIYLKSKVLENLIVDSGNEVFSAVGTTLYSKDGKTLIAELGDPVSIDVPEGVEEISGQAFDRLTSLCEIKLPSTLKKIGEKAFAGTSLKTVECPTELETIGLQAFSFCRSLDKVEFNEGLKEIGQQAFEGCPIEDVYIPASVEEIGNDSFFAISNYQGQQVQQFRIDPINENFVADGIALYKKQDDMLTLIKAYSYDLRITPNEEGKEPIDYSILDGTVAIGPHAFARCNNLKSVAFPEGVMSIGDMAFWDCTKVAEVNLPESCKEISPKAFFGTEIKVV